MSHIWMCNVYFFFLFFLWICPVGVVKAVWDSLKLLKDQTGENKERKAHALFLPSQPAMDIIRDNNIRTDVPSQLSYISILLHFCIPYSISDSLVLPVFTQRGCSSSLKFQITLSLMLRSSDRPDGKTAASEAFQHCSSETRGFRTRLLQLLLTVLPAHREYLNKTKACNYLAWTERASGMLR